MEQVAKNIHIPYSQKVRDSSSDIKVKTIVTVRVIARDMSYIKGG